MAAIADFRSDTLTQPHAAMREAMAQAVVGDDVWGEDPTIRSLEEHVADLLGKQAAVFVPSGTMANQIGIHVHCRPGDELICEERSHVFYYEGGAIARLSGTQVRSLPARDGFPTAAQITSAVRVDDPHYPRSRLLVLENTHNMAGGRVADAGRIAALADAARSEGMLVHVDGARLMNAAVALGCPPADLVAAADSTTLCLSKGLGAPVGSLLAGDAEFIHEARRARKAFGGGMRQAGVLAAAGLLAIQEGPGLLAVDHQRAKRLATGLAELDWTRHGDVGGLAVDLEATESNIVMLNLAAEHVAPLLSALAQDGVQASGAGGGRIRFVLHRDLDDESVSLCMASCRKFLAS
jgi:threonine aldolase